MHSHTLNARTLCLVTRMTPFRCCRHSPSRTARPLRHTAWAGSSPARTGGATRGFFASAAANGEVVVPPMGDSVSEGSIAAVLKQPGVCCQYLNPHRHCCGTHRCRWPPTHRLGNASVACTAPCRQRRAGLPLHASPALRAPCPPSHQQQRFSRLCALALAAHAHPPLPPPLLCRRGRAARGRCGGADRDR